VVGRKTPLSLVQALLPPNQEMMGENDQRHVMVPPVPKTQFVVIHAQLPLVFGKTRLDGPTHPTDPHKGGKRRLHRSVAQIKLPLRLLWRPTHFAPDHYPDLWTWQPIQRQHRAQDEEVGDQWTFVSFQQSKSLPARGGLLLGQIFHCHFGWRVGMQALPAGSRSFA